MQSQSVISGRVERASASRRQDRAGADLQERPHARQSHVLDLADELDRAGELLGEQVAGVCRLVGVLAGRRLAKTGTFGVELTSSTARPERLARRAHQRAVEGGRHRQPGRADCRF